MSYSLSESILLFSGGEEPRVKADLPQIAKSTLQSIPYLFLFSIHLLNFVPSVFFYLLSSSPNLLSNSVYLSVRLSVYHLSSTYLPTYPFIFPQLPCLFGLAVFGTGGVAGFSVPLTWNSFTCRTRHGR